MNKRNKWLLVLLLAGLVVGLISCKPLAYYLEQVYKVHGRVTVANADTTIPLTSVEVSVGAYEYSELTNSLGDYEMELPEGTWTIKFAKQGCQTLTADPITVGPLNPRQELNAALVCDVIDLTGWWRLYVGDDTVSYGRLFGAHIIVDSKIVLTIHGQRVTLTIDGPDEMHGEVELEPGWYVDMVFQREAPPEFGTLDLTFQYSDGEGSETYRLQTDEGFGDIEGPILYEDEDVILRIWVGAPEDYDVEHVYTFDHSGPGLTLRGHGGDEFDEVTPTSGRMTITRYVDARGLDCIKGTFTDVRYEYDDEWVVLNGTYDLPITTDAAI